MARFQVDMRIDFSGEVEANSVEEAENIAWTNWGDSMDSLITYEGVYSMDVEEIEEEEEDEEDE